MIFSTEIFFSMEILLRLASFRHGTFDARLQFCCAWTSLQHVRGIREGICGNWWHLTSFEALVLGQWISCDQWKVDDFWYFWMVMIQCFFQIHGGPLNLRRMMGALPGITGRKFTGSEVLLATWSWCVLLGPPKSDGKVVLCTKRWSKNMLLDQNSNHRMNMNE